MCGTDLLSNQTIQKWHSISHFQDLPRYPKEHAPLTYEFSILAGILTDIEPTIFQGQALLLRFGGRLAKASLKIQRPAYIFQAQSECLEFTGKPSFLLQSLGQLCLPGSQSPAKSGAAEGGSSREAGGLHDSLPGGMPTAAGGGSHRGGFGRAEQSRPPLTPPRWSTESAVGDHRQASGFEVHSPLSSDESKRYSE
jgi:hypothetical protein